MRCPWCGRKLRSFFRCYECGISLLDPAIEARRRARGSMAGTLPASLDDRSTFRNPALVAIVAEGFASRLSFGIISFALPLYAHRLGLSIAEIGLLSSLHLAAALVLKPLLGGCADYFGLKRSLCVALGLRSLVAALFGVAAAPWQLFTIRAAHGLAKALRDPAADALIAEHGSKKAIASAFAWHQTAKTLAGSIGKALAGILLTLTASQFSLVFLVAFLLSAAPMLLVIRWVPAPRRSHRAAEPAALEDAAPDAERVPPRDSGPALLPFAGLAFLITATAQMLQGIFPILATQYAGLSEAETGAIYLASGVAVLVAGPCFGWLSDKVSRNLVFAIRSLANTLSSLIYLVSPSFGGIAVGRVVDDVGKAAFRPAWGSLMAQLSSFEPKRRARTMGVMSAGEDVGEIAGPILAGVLWSAGGIGAALGLRVVLAVVTEIYTVVLTNRVVSAPPREPVLAPARQPEEA